MKTPVQLGPIKLPFTEFIVSTIRFSSIAPSLLSSAKPAEIIIKAFTPFLLAKISTASGHKCEAIAKIAKSIFSGNSSTDE
ncbi:MAG: hypothetical protein BWX61_01108 [Bacteroidetes bacterium ADurb.Bin035]|nr:MAG: hypothetical protein BWX61_01108 [Bacteroidetes bacterium ADurb.Bin035]